MKYIKLKEILSESKIVSDTPNPDKRITVKLNMGGVEKRALKKAEGTTKYFIRNKGQFIYGKQNLFKGAFGIVPDELDGFESTSDIPSFDVDDSCDVEWIVRYLQCNKLYKKLEDLAKGSGSKRIYPEQLYEIEIPIVNKNIQKTILKTIRNTEIVVDDLMLTINSQEKYISYLRHSILQQAVEGKLCEQNADEEPASVLLEKIKEDKEKRIANKKIKKQKEMPPITEEEKPFNLPKGWEWCRLCDVSLSLSTGPFGSILHKNDYVTDGVPLVNPKNIVNNSIVIDSQMSVSVETQIKLSSYKLNLGDLVIGRRGEMGRCALVKKENVGFLCGTGCFFVSVSCQSNLLYLLKYLISPNTIAYLEKESVGTTMNNLNHRILSNLLIALPPLAEQQRIVEKVDSIMALCDELEQEVSKVKKYVSQLMAAVLQEAFSGAIRESQDNVIGFAAKPMVQQKQMQFAAAARGNINESTWNKLVSRALELAGEEN